MAAGGGETRWINSCGFLVTVPPLVDCGFLLSSSCALCLLSSSCALCLNLLDSSSEGTRSNSEQREKMQEGK